MPNWCDNKLEVIGDPDLLRGFVSANEGTGDDAGSPLSFASQVPEPSTTDDEQYNWYDWRVTNWGTKWNLDNETTRSLHEDGGRAWYSFSSAWEPPGEWLRAVAAKNPELRFHMTWDEPGMGYSGEVYYRNGGAVSEDAFRAGFEPPPMKVNASRVVF